MPSACSGSSHRCGGMETPASLSTADDPWRRRIPAPSRRGPVSPQVSAACPSQTRVILFPFFVKTSVRMRSIHDALRVSCVPLEKLLTSLDFSIGFFQG